MDRWSTIGNAHSQSDTGCGASFAAASYLLRDSLPSSVLVVGGWWWLLVVAGGVAVYDDEDDDGGRLGAPWWLLVNGECWWLCPGVVKREVRGHCKQQHNNRASRLLATATSRSEEPTNREFSSIGNEDFIIEVLRSLALNHSVVESTLVLCLIHWNDR